MYVPEWFVVLSFFLCASACVVLLALLSMWISSIVRFVRECRLTFNLVNLHGERMHEIEKRIDVHGTRIFEIEKQVKRFRSR